MKKLIVLIVISLILSMFGCQQQEEEIPNLTASDVNELIKDIESEDISFYIYHDEKKNISELIDSSNIETYRNSRFITLTNTNKDNLKDCLNLFKYEYKWDDTPVTIIDNLYNAINSLHRHESDVLVIPEELIQKLSTIDDNRITALVSRLEKIYQYDEKMLYKYELINKPFLFYAGGSDERADELVEKSRYDTDILLAISPIHKQILIVSIPRDMRTPNPAHEYKDDKLTHLGDDGPLNVLSGLNTVFKTDINLYAVTNFTEFKRFIDFMGGLDIYNPYTFTYTGSAITFYEGNLHLDGNLALHYARERQHIPEGDIGRNKHQAILIKAMIKKVLAFDSIDKYLSIIPEIKKSFMTNLDFEQVLILAQWYLENRSEWTFITKQIYGDIDFIWTATYNTVQQLGVITPHQEDIDEATKMINTVLSGEILKE